MKNKLLLIATAVFLTSSVFGQIQKKGIVATRVNTPATGSSTRQLAPIQHDTAFSIFPDEFPGDTVGSIYTFTDGGGYPFGTNEFKFNGCAETYDWATNKIKLTGATFFFEVAKFKKGKGADTVTCRVYKTKKGGAKPKGLGLTSKSVTLSTIANNIKAGKITKVKFPLAITMDTVSTWMISFEYKATGGDTIAIATGLFRNDSACCAGYTNTWVRYPAVGTKPVWYASSNDSAFGEQSGITMYVGAWITIPATKNSPAVETMVYNVPGLSVSAYPNPSSTSFKLNIMSPQQDPITIRVMDVAGRQVAVYNQVQNGIFEFGNNLASGMYMVQVVQGSTIKSFKLIKN